MRSKVASTASIGPSSTCMKTPEDNRIAPVMSAAALAARAASTISSTWRSTSSGGPARAASLR